MDKLSELRLAYDKMGAEIEKLEAEPKSVWKPKMGEAYYFVSSNGQVQPSVFANDNIGKNRLASHIAYQTANQAYKASFLTRQSNRIIQACISFDPDFVTYWRSSKIKYSVFYANDSKRWIVSRNTYNCGRPAYVSSNEIAQSICDMFNAEDKL